MRAAGFSLLKRIAFLSVGVASISAANALNSENAWAAETAALKPATLQLSYLGAGQRAAYAYGLVKGLYAKEGIDLKMLEGAGSGAAVKSAADNRARFVQADASAIAIAVSQGSPVKAIASIMYATPYGLIFSTKSGFKGAQSLKGKKIGMVRGEAPLLLLPVFLKANDLSEKDVTIVYLDQKEKLPQLKAGKVDAIGYNVLTKAGIELELGEPVGIVSYSIKLPLPGDVLATNVKNIGDKEANDLNCRMVRALAESLKGSIEHPDEAVKALHQIWPQASQGSVEASKDAWGKMSETITSRHLKKAIGTTYDEDWTRMLSILKENGSIKDIRPLGAYFTNEFVDCGEKK